MVRTKSGGQRAKTLIGDNDMLDINRVIQQQVGKTVKITVSIEDSQPVNFITLTEKDIDIEFDSTNPESLLYGFIFLESELDNLVIGQSIDKFKREYSIGQYTNGTYYLPENYQELGDKLILKSIEGTTITDVVCLTADK